MELVIIDNYDSFTYNLVHMVNSIIGKDVDVIRNDKISPGALDKYDKFILSPGPGIPEEAGQLLNIIKEYSASKSIFGVCLGLQAIAETNGCKLKNMEEVYHGIATDIVLTNNDEPLFSGLGKSIKGGRYHSWVVDPDYVPVCMTVTAVDRNNDIMAMRHKVYDLSGVQFHPESILTPSGSTILANWLDYN